MLTKFVYPIILLLCFSVQVGHSKDLYVERDKNELKLFSFNLDKHELVEEKYIQLESTLGSIWKLFIYAYYKEKELTSSPYVCRGEDLKEVFCCSKGQSIDANEAIAKSCGLFFDPDRLRIRKEQWRVFWKSKGLNYNWLTNLNNLKAGTIVPVDELLNSLDKVRLFPKAKKILDKSLMDVVLKGTAKNSLSRFGSTARLKTFTWDHPTDSRKYIGGFAGWLNDGRIVWGRGDGTSALFLNRVSRTLEKRWSNSRFPEERQCVTVRYFHDYEIKDVIDLSTREKVHDGILTGRYKIRFKSGQTLMINSNESLRLKSENGKVLIDGKMGMISYVARVLDREVDSRYQSAAEAFSIVVRSYLEERAGKQAGCFHVIDSSKFQRVSANIPSKRSLLISKKMLGLVLNNVDSIRYHLNKDSENMISWKKAKELSKKGMNYKEILKISFPSSEIVLRNSRYQSSCYVLERAERWLKGKIPKWHRFLLRFPGYEKPSHFTVCRISSGSPFANKKSNEIYVRGFENFENQYSVAHEYLHLAFKHHPIGNNETKIDLIAKKLVRMF